jgi:hypothetical protein
MKFDNKNEVVKVQMLKLIYLLVVAVFIAFAFSSDLWNYVDNSTGVSKWLFGIVLFSIYLVYYIFHIVKRSSYVYFDDDGSKVIIRFYNLNPFDSKKNSYEIPKDQLVDYTFHRSLFGIRQHITIVRRMTSSNAQYPPFSISLLPEAQKKKLFVALDFHCKK